MRLLSDMKSSLATMRSSRWRNYLTMLGIIVGVFSVVTTVSIGEGVRQQVERQILHLGSDLITVRPGRIVNKSNDTITGVNLLANFGGTVLSEKDYLAVKNTVGVGLAVPFSLVSAVPTIDGQEYTGGFIVATNPGLPEVLNQKIKFGAFFTADEQSKNVVVIGKNVAEELFKENVPIGKSLFIRGERFVVNGIFEPFDTSPLFPNSDYNAAIFVPYDVGKRINGDQSHIYQVLAKPKEPDTVPQTVQRITKNLSDLRGAQQDFTVLRQIENLTLANKVLSLLTAMITSVAAISLLVGGIGIMNIMLVSVIERTNEIGVRKAVGATNRQILNQFLTEAAVLSLSGGLLGVGVSLVVTYFIRILTNLQPVITLPIMFVAVGAAFFVGIFFGIAPALKAATKDPIEALRHD